MTELKFNKFNIALVIIAFLVLIIIVVSVCCIDGGSCNEEEQIDVVESNPYSGEIFGPSQIEMGQEVVYSATLMHYNESVSDYLKWEVVSVDDGKAFFEKGFLIPEASGNVTIKAKFNDFVLEKKVTIFENASINSNMKAWIHPDNWYSLGITSAGVKDIEVHLYKVTETGRTVEVTFSDDGKWRIFGNKEILIQERGNYLVEIKAKALSDNRTISIQGFLTVTSFVQKGYNQISWSNQNLVEFDPSDLVSIGIFLKEEILVTDILISGEPVTVNHISSGYYYFYKDPSRDDTILYQTGVNTDVGENKKMLFAKTVASDGTVWYLLWDDFIVVASKENPFSYRGFDSSSNDYSPSVPAPVPAPIPIVIISPSPLI